MTQLVPGEDDVQHLLAEIAHTTSAELESGTVATNMYRPATNDFKVTVMQGNEDARDKPKTFTLGGGRRQLLQ